MPPADQLADEIVRLYGVAPEEFVAARNAAAKQARQEGRKDDAAAIATLRKPSVIEGAINRTARRDPDATSAWVAATRAADAAQSATIGGADAAGLRSAVAELRTATAALVDATVVTLGDDGKRDDIAAFLRSVPVGALHQVELGILGSAARAEDDLFAGAPAPPPRSRRPAHGSKPAARTETAPARGRAARPTADADPSSDTRSEDAGASTRRAPKPERKPSARERKLAATLERRRAALAEVEAARADARRAVDDARHRLETVEREHAEAEAALDEAEVALRTEQTGRDA
jgi:hypothetical protein